jgi:DNA polymerase-3 subunit delta
LVCGEDDFSAKKRARQIFQQWSTEVGGFDHEIINATANNSGDALAALAKLREALQTLPFFGSGKVIWFQNCNFLGDERTAEAQSVTETLGEIARELKEFPWQDVRLIVSAGKVDKRKTFYKTLEKIGSVEVFAGWSLEDKNWSAAAEHAAEVQLRELGKKASDAVLSRLIQYVGPNARQLASEVEKVALFAGNRAEISIDDVEAIVSRNKQSRAFALADALGARDLRRLLRALDESLWEVRRDPQKSEIGLLYGLISKVRIMIFIKEMLARGWIKADADYFRFKGQLEAVPAEALPEDKRFNPLGMHPYMLHQALGQAKNYSSEELIRAMDLLLECNQQLVSRSLDEALVLQRTLVKIVSGNGLSGLP